MECKTTYHIRLVFKYPTRASPEIVSVNTCLQN